MHRNSSSSGMGAGAPNFAIPSPGSRQNSFSGIPGGQPYPMHSPAQHMQIPQQQHPQHMGMQATAAQLPNMASGGMHSSASDRQRQQYIPTGLNGNWQSDRDMPHRREMIQHM
jgi:hypothetical protein